MRVPKPFDPIEPGGIDYFSFDFAPYMGDDVFAAVNPVSWTCAMAPLQTGFDANPQARIISVGTETLMNEFDASSGTVIAKPGKFAVALAGNFPVSALNSTYVLEATVVTAEGRRLNLSGTVLCSVVAGP
jgi:hypothetical protein